MLRRGGEVIGLTVDVADYDRGDSASSPIDR
jgi:hypothetical protein